MAYKFVAGNAQTQILQLKNLIFNFLPPDGNPFCGQPRCGPENLEKLLMVSNAVSFIAEAETDEINEVMEELEAAVDWQMKKQENGSVRVDVKIEFGEVSDVCRHLFFAFAQREKALLELSSKKANLEDVFLELTESGVDTASVDNGGKTDKSDIELTENNNVEWMERQVNNR